MKSAIAKYDHVVQCLQELKQTYRNAEMFETVLSPRTVNFTQSGLYVRSHAIYKSCQKWQFFFRMMWWESMETEAWSLRGRCLNCSLWSQRMSKGCFHTGFVSLNLAAHWSAFAIVYWFLCQAVLKCRLKLSSSQMMVNQTLKCWFMGDNLVEFHARRLWPVICLHKGQFMLSTCARVCKDNTNFTMHPSLRRLLMFTSTCPKFVTLWTVCMLWFILERVMIEVFAGTLKRLF